MFREKNIRKHLIFSGRVQGVGFLVPGHEYCPDAGFDRLGKESVGWKSRDGSPGKKGRDRKLISMLYQQRFIWIEDIEEKEIPVEKESSFSIH